MAPDLRPVYPLRPADELHMVVTFTDGTVEVFKATVDGVSASAGPRPLIMTFRDGERIDVPLAA